MRKFFEVDKEYIVTYTLSALAKEQLISSKYAEKAISNYNIEIYLGAQVLVCKMILQHIG